MAQVAHNGDSATVQARIRASSGEIAVFCQEHHLRWLALFGSVLRDDFADGSDSDVLVEFAPAVPVTFFDLHDMETALSRMFGGRKIDLVTRESLHQRIRARVLPLVEAIHAEG